MGHIDIGDLPISRTLSDKVKLWDDEYQSTFNDEYPRDSGFCFPQEKVRHVNDGRGLAQEMQAELGSSYNVEYCPLDFLWRLLGRNLNRSVPVVPRV